MAKRILGAALFTQLRGKAFAATPAFTTVRFPASEFHALEATSLAGEPFSFSALKNKVVMITNVASQ